ncbi:MULTISPECIES: branched-chain amino acid ABC transporter ATP-binding protein/permease [Ramlibacter]|uniref:ATP-binding cassette domain-containing protein n=1 Tax=Ramlibacter pinisoli TaxID=2682844 RepID=A0A6N8J0Q8_9BURK|nr:MULTISPECIES: branched-chain amino acid ABC transporter ATP-binding protein/permease [Ramlibacter]MBA2962745.1 ATP-binding cassette domain-containing protein [Ramlibacter sp. CGMCC 1.13660]MVQ32687.1 ATP-binding cassette domain-containing protein [Ramlibacter pinisoli]
MKALDRLQPALAILLVAAGLVLAARANGYDAVVIGQVALLACVGIGLNVLLGLTGQISFGHVGFYALGAYAVAVLTSKAGWSFWLAWPVAALLAGAVGALLALPALRVRGPYLAMVTIAFGFIVEHGVVEWRSVTGGQNGIMGIAAPALPGLPAGVRGVAMLAVALAGALLLAYTLLARGTWGAALRAVRDSETAAQSLGFRPLVLRTVAFALSAFCAGAAGALFAPLSGFVTPQAFGFIQSILFVLVVLVGGAGAAAGPIVGALVVGLLPEWLSRLEEYRLLFFGALLLVVLWAAPDGLVGLARRLLARWRVAPAPRTASAVPALSPLVAARPAEAATVLQARGLAMQFGGVRAVQGLDLDVPAGRITSLIGPNGAGKTTALNMLSGFYRPSAGGFALGGQALAGLPAHRIARAGIARTYQTSQLFGSLTVEDNVALATCAGTAGPLLGAARFRAPAVRRTARDLLAFCGYAGALDRPAADLAHVDRRLVEIARALAMRPALLLLDEPAAGLAREDKDRLAALLGRIAGAGTAVLLVEHDMPLVMAVSDQVVVLDAGQRIAAGTPATVQDDPAVRQAYLGEQLELAPAAGRAAPAAAAPELLGIGRLVADHGAGPVLRGVDLRVREGELVALLGANGAGKSTLMRAVAGLHRPVGGGIHLGGREVAGLPAERIARLGLVLVPEGRQVFPELSVLDNLRLGAFTRPQGREARVEDMLRRFPRLRERLHQRAGLLSGGEQQMLAVARGLMAMPRVLLLDEPSLGLAPKVIAELFAALDVLRGERMTIVLVDQIAALALALADRGYVIEGGTIVAEGPAAQLAQDDLLARAYLGAGTAAAEEPPLPIAA